ncbi:hypothetical protein JUNP479_3353 [Aeromonas jandaei]|uniref:YkgJ family cysteine cluster protein n=1 Tax=Aeromonas jandaei TaxID=650 RepID=UPI001951F332|nr:YkgJ family cysteine cluster protein [Aeromonas jandaei]BCS50573.1 hypothetical protein JUNP479_3353 [Aeromonas jandaei]
MRNLDADKKIAYRNITRIQALIPKKLLLKEEKIAKKQAESSDSDINKLQQLLKLTDELTSKISPITTCKSGCGNCCNINVSITKIEAQLISLHTGKELNESLPLNKADFHGEPCTFLIDNKCSIYAVRPFVCRRLVSFMPSDYWCNPELSLKIEVPLINFSELSRAFYAIASRNEVKDIRAWFG